MDETILHDCLTRIERGESVESCLKLYGEVSAELEPHLRIAAALKQPEEHLPAQRDARIESQLLAAFRERQAHSPVSSRTFFRYSEQFKQITEKMMSSEQQPTTQRRKGWVVFGNLFAFALGAIILIGGGLAILSQWQRRELSPVIADVTVEAIPDVEQSLFQYVQPLSANVAIVTTLPAEQVVNSYDITIEPVTNEMAFALAQSLGISEPTHYSSNKTPDPNDIPHLFGSNGATLSIHNGNQLTYFNPVIDIPAEESTLSEEVASEYAVQFLEKIGYLPETFQSALSTLPSSHSHLTRIEIVPLVDTRPIRTQSSLLTIDVHPSGEIVSARFSRIILTPTNETQTVSSAQSAFEAVRQGEDSATLLSSMMSNPTDWVYQHLFPLSPTHAVGDVVNVTGKLQILYEVGNPENVRLSVYSRGGTYLLEGTFDIGTLETLQRPIQLTVKVERVVRAGIWEVSVIDLKETNLEQICEYGTTRWEDNVVLFSAEGATADYRLERVPATFDPSVNSTVCYYTVDEQGMVDWFTLERHPAHNDAGLSGHNEVIVGVVTEVVEVVETDSSDAEPMITPTPLVRGEFTITEQNPDLPVYELGEIVTVAGYLDVEQIVSVETGAFTAYEIRLRQRIPELEPPIFADHIIVGDSEQLAALAAYAHQFVSLSGEIVAPQSEQQASIGGTRIVKLNAFEPLSDGASPQLYLGTAEVKHSSDGVEYILFTSTDGEQFVIRHGVSVHPQDSVILADGVIVEGTPYPDFTIDGIPVLYAIHTGAFDSMETAEESLENYVARSAETTITYGDFLTERLFTNVIIDSVYLAYTLDMPMGNPNNDPISTLVPVWVFEGMTSNGLQTVEYVIRPLIRAAE